MVTPLVSIVTPSYNQGRFLEATIQSVLNQTYKPIQYIIVDDCSRDESLAIALKYAKRVMVIQHPHNMGPSKTINTGFKLATGSIYAWLDSDNIMLPHCVQMAVETMLDNPTSDMVTGDRQIIDSDGRVIGERRLGRFFKWQFRYCSGISQESTFFSRSIYEQLGGIDESIFFPLDYDFYIRASNVTSIKHIPVIMGQYRKHKETHSTLSKGRTAKGLMMSDEVKRVRQKHFGRDTSRFEMFLLPRLHNLLRKI